MSRFIVSFTSYPERISAVKSVLDSLYAQTLKADEIILWLAEEQFPQREAGLPHLLQEDLMAKRFTLRWCENLGSHKKYFYTMQEYPEDIIVTVDDDTFYHPDTLKMLMETHTRFPSAVVARTTSLILFDNDYNPLPISEWLFDFQGFTEPSMLLMAIGVGGVLYPPHAVSHEIFDKDFILETCMVNGRTSGDDLLLKVGEILNHVPVVPVKSEPYFRVPNTQETALAKLMPNESHKNLFIRKYKERFLNSLDMEAAKRLQDAVSDFKEKDDKFELRKSYWLTRPSRDLDRQIGYLLLPNAPSKPDASDYKVVKAISRFAARVFTAYPPDTADDKTTEEFNLFRQQLREIPDIQVLAGTDVVVGGLINYDTPLNTDCPIIWHGNPIYWQSMKNWRLFMNNHPNCSPIYHKGYQAFLKNTESAIKKAEAVLPRNEIDKWKSEYEEVINDNPAAGPPDKLMERIKKRIKHLFRI